MNPFQQQAPISGVKKIIAVGSGKGGVGKSTVAVNLALGLKTLGKSVGLLDADIYGPSLPRLTGTLQQRPEISSGGKIQPITRLGMRLMSMGYMVNEDLAIVWRGPMLFKAMDQFFRDVQWGDLDYLIVDLPPGTGDVALTLAQKVPVDGGIVVCTPQNMALTDARKAVDMFEKINIRCLGFVENMAFMLAPGSGERLQLFPKGDLDQYLEAHHLPKLSQIPFNPQVGLACEAGVPSVESDRESEESQAFIALARQVITHLES